MKVRILLFICSTGGVFLGNKSQNKAYIPVTAASALKLNVSSGEEIDGTY